MPLTERTTNLLVDLALNALVLVDRAGVIIRVNPQAEKLFGYGTDELLGKSVEELVPAAWRTRHPEYRDAFFANPAVRSMGAGRDLHGRRKDGSEFPIEIGLNPLQADDELMVVASVVDITERRRAEERFRLVVESAPSAMVLVDDSGAIILVNRQTEQLFGYRRDELLGQPVELLVPERFRARHPAYRREFFLHPETRPMGAGRDLRGRRRDGVEFPVEIGLTPIAYDDGWVILSSIVDITERQEAEDQARRQMTELAHAQRLSTVGELFSGLAHEINQPLAAAANYARTCLRHARGDGELDRDKLVEWVEKAAGQTARAIEILGRVGTYVRREESRFTQLSLNLIVQDVLSIHGLTLVAAHGGRVPPPELALQENLPRVSGDRIQIEQVLVNLIRNGIEAMADLPFSARRLLIATSADKNNVTVSVADHGHGLAPDQLAKLFSPFFTTKPQGMGLGLSISRTIIEAHGGELLAESEAGKGATFSFRLPAAKDPEIHP